MPRESAASGPAADDDHVIGIHCAERFRERTPRASSRGDETPQKPWPNASPQSKYAPLLALRCSLPVFFRLSTWELWLIIAGLVLGFVAIGYAAGRVLRMQAETLREPVGNRAGGVLRTRRAGPRLWSDAGYRALRRTPDRRRRRREHHRDDVPARTDPGRADAKPLAPTAQAVHGRQPGALARGPDHRQVRTRGRPARRSPAPALDAGGERAQGRATRQRSTALRRDPERDDRPADGARRRAQQPHPQRRPAAGGVRRRVRLRPARAVHGDARAGGHHRRLRRRARDRAPAGHLRPRSAHAGPDPRPRHAARRAARLDDTPAGSARPVSDEPLLGGADRRGRERRGHHRHAARPPPGSRGELLRGRRPRGRGLRRPRDRLRRAARLRRLPCLPELRHLAQRRRDRGADRPAAVRDGPAHARRGAWSLLG